MPLVAAWAELYAESEGGSGSGLLFKPPQAPETELAVQVGEPNACSVSGGYVKDEPNSECDQELSEAVLENPFKVKEEFPQEQPVHITSSDQVAEDRCNLVEAVSVKEEPISKCSQPVSEAVQALLADLSDKVQHGLPQHTAQQKPVDVAPTDRGGVVYTYSKRKTVCVKEKPESECVKKVSDYRLALLEDLSNTVKDELDVEEKHPVNVTSTDGAPGCSGVSGERALRQIVNGCYVKLYRHRLGLQCHVCRKMFQKRTHLEAHTCDQKDAFENDKKIHVPKLLNKKITTAVNMKVYTCKICHKGYRFPSSLKLHELKHSRKDVICDICKRDFSNKYRLEIHMLTHLDGQQGDMWKPIACDLCNKVFPYRSKLRRHRHTCASWFRCDLCKRKFKLESSLIDHKKNHPEKRTFTCGYCKKRFDDRSRFIEHKKIHRKAFFVCDVCNKKFYHKRFIIEHVIRVHGDDKRYVCLICETIFIDKSQFEDHKKVHTNKQLLRCDICGNVYREQSSLTSHMRFHTDEKPYPCEICQKTFRLKHHLTEHKIIHTVEKPYVCDICKKAFTSQPNLIKHTKSHMAHKPYVCHFCKKAYIQKSDLNVHIRIHTGEKPFVCNICSRPFRHNSNLYAHKKTVHKKVDSSCL